MTVRVDVRFLRVKKRFRRTILAKNVDIEIKFSTNCKIKNRAVIKRNFGRLSGKFSENIVMKTS